MTKRLVSRLAVTTVAAVGLYVFTLGLPLPGSCMRTGGVASAVPSPTCGGDLRECLRLSAKEGLYGVRYVTADDVAKCVEAFNACTHGTVQGGSNSPGSTTTEVGGSKGLPTRFRMNYGNVVSDCRVSGDMVTCAETQPPTGDMDSWEGKTTGSLSGLTVTGTKTARLRGHGAVDSGCVAIYDYSGPVTLVFSTDGKVLERWGPNQLQLNWSGSCPGSRTETTPVAEQTGKWSPVQ